MVDELVDLFAVLTGMGLGELRGLDMVGLGLVDLGRKLVASLGGLIVDRGPLIRGLLGGVLMRRLGPGWGNLLQATIFLAPHMALLLLDVRLWPLLPAQFAAGWMMGWLRHKTDTFVPGAVVHVMVNIVVGLITA